MFEVSGSDWNLFMSLYQREVREDENYKKGWHYLIGDELVAVREKGHFYLSAAAARIIDHIRSIKYGEI